MKILIVIGLNNSLIECLVGPLSHMKDIQEIMLVRSQPGVNLPGVRYYCPPGAVARYPIFATICKFGIALYLTLVKRPSLIHSFLIFPSGLIAFAVATLSGIPCSLTLNAGPVELYGIGGSPLGIDYNRPLPWSGRLFLWILKHARTVIVLNSATRDFLFDHGINKERIHILPQPVSPEKFHPLNTMKKYVFF